MVVATGRRPARPPSLRSPASPQVEKLCPARHGASIGRCLAQARCNIQTSRRSKSAKLPVRARGRRQAPPRCAQAPQELQLLRHGVGQQTPGPTCEAIACFLPSREAPAQPPKGSRSASAMRPPATRANAWQQPTWQPLPRRLARDIMRRCLAMKRLSFVVPHRYGRTDPPRCGARPRRRRSGAREWRQSNVLGASRGRHATGA